MTDLTTDCFDDLNNSELVNQTNNFDIQTNPWQVEDIGTFSYFCCPECIYRAKTVSDFQVHSIINHPNSKDFFERYGDKYWLEHGDEGENNGDMDSEPIKVINPFCSMYCKVSFFGQCSKMQLIPLQNFIIKTRFIQFLWFFRLKC